MPNRLNLALSQALQSAAVIFNPKFQLQFDLFFNNEKEFGLTGQDQLT